MIEIITKKVEMPEYDKLRYKYTIDKNKWIVIDTHNNDSIRYKGKYEMAAIACHNLNKKHYLKK
jgi:hypothetical protein